MGRLIGRFIPRSLAGWFAACWGLFLLAAIVAGSTLVSLYRDGTTERLRRAEAALARGCDAITERYRFATTGSARIDWQDPETVQLLTAATLVALRDLPGVEGGLWRSGAGPLAYAYPTYEGAGPKTDVPAAELSRIGETAEAAILRGVPVIRRYDARTQALLLRACPLPGTSLNLAAWVMDRVILFGGPAYLRAAAALAVLTAVLLGSAAWLGWLLWGWSRRLRQIEAALAGSGAEDLPRLAATGQRDLDRVVQAVNGAAGRLAEARRAAAAAAARANEAERLAGLGRVAAGVAHEVRNPIAAMRLKAENALAARDPDRMRRALDVVLAQVGRLDTLTRDLLDAARGGAPLRRHATDLGALVGDRVAFYREQAGAAGVSLEAGGDAIPPAALDGERLERALDNLILNALQATPPGGRVEVAACRGEDGLVLSVADTGRGVPEALRAHLFEPFASGRPEGTGLGLAQVREAAEAHGGRVRALHRDDGTTIEIILPEGPAAAWPAS
ncbi:sensor histidine kinase [Paracraurococcus lichenis]|uniref:histidine kinase n=1 Tax=Paracraurococcus lichenis TaxID=3064888 RepID=A0ABT9E7S8_9PROT|nr:HAMP domain-containing sensor histidine kinase [Paracraurococcus sp. LOR1-02]MDO9712201.1 HAMP domain-containing sensor histidine kinase [Paracraurococcus sp. LOR1-02]